MHCGTNWQKTSPWVREPTWGRKMCVSYAALPTPPSARFAGSSLHAPFTLTIIRLTSFFACQQHCIDSFYLVASFSLTLNCLWLKASLIPHVYDNWKLQTSEGCAPYRVATLEGAGRGLVAVRDIRSVLSESSALSLFSLSSSHWLHFRKGELIFTCLPAALGPTAR